MSQEKNFQLHKKENLNLKGTYLKQNRHQKNTKFEFLLEEI